MPFGVPTSFGSFQTSSNSGGNTPFGVSTGLFTNISTSSGFGTGFGQPSAFVGQTSSSSGNTMFGVPINNTPSSPFGVSTPSNFGIGGGFWQTAGNNTMSINEHDSPADKIASVSAVYNNKSHEELRSENYGNIKGSRRLPYAATRAEDEFKGKKISILLHSISAMQVYENKSHEELRMEDYEERAKGVQTPWGNKASNPSGAPVFTNPQGSHSFTPFSTPATNPFSPSTNPFTPQIPTTTTTPTPSISPSPFFPKTNPFTTTQPANPFSPPTNPFPTINTTPISPSPFSQKNSPFTTSTQPTNPFSPSTNLYPFTPTTSTTPTPSVSPFTTGTQPTNPFSPSTSPFSFTPQSQIPTTSTIPTPSVSPFTTTTQPTNPFSPSPNIFPFSPQTPTINTTPTPSTSPFTTTSTQPTNPFSPSTNLFPFSSQSQIPTTSTSPTPSISPSPYPQNNNLSPIPPFPNPFPQSQPFMTPNSVNRASTPATTSDSMFRSNTTNIFGHLLTTPPNPSPQTNLFAPPSQPFPLNISQPGLTCATTQSQPLQVFTTTVQLEAVTSTRHGISSLPVKNNSAPVRMSSSYRIRHLSSRRVSLPANRYNPESCVSRVPFFGDKEYKLCLAAPFLPRENPRAWVINEPSELKHAPIDVYKEQGETCEDKAGAKSCFQVNANLCLADDTVVSSLMPKLPCGGEYYTEPSIKELEEKERAEPGFCSHVKNFVVGRKDKGNIVFLGETDIRYLDLESIVQFNDREVIVYKDEENKPPIGQGLNRPAEVTLLNVKFHSKTSGKQCSEDGQHKMEKMVMKKTNEHGAEFVSYNPVRGEWKFRVEHF